jgi:hypothetical protein
MASTYWIKLYHEILHDPKMCRLSDHLYRRCIELFLQAGETDRDGELPTVEDMAWTFRSDTEVMLADLKGLEAVGIVNQRNGIWIVTKFSERQAPVDGAERVSRFRERKHKAEYYGQPESDTDTETDTEPEPAKETITVSATDSNADCNESLQQVKQNVTHIRLDKIRLDTESESESEKIRQDIALPVPETAPPAPNISLSRPKPDFTHERRPFKPPPLPPGNPDCRQLSNPEIYEYIERTYAIWKDISAPILPSKDDKDHIALWGRTHGRQHVLEAFEAARGKLKTLPEIYNSLGNGQSPGEAAK